MIYTASILKDRVRSNIGPDRELDADVYRFLGAAPTCGSAPSDWQYKGEGVWYQEDLNKPYEGRLRRAPRYTVSTDANILLIMRELPAWHIAQLSQGDNGDWFAELRRGKATSYTHVIIQPPAGYILPLPRTLLTIFLEAYEYEQELLNKEPSNG